MERRGHWPIIIRAAAVVVRAQQRAGVYQGGVRFLPASVVLPRTREHRAADRPARWVVRIWVVR
jgi:hypothetical protein